MSKEEIVKQTEKLEKTDKGFKLTVTNYGGNKDNMLIQHFSKEKLKEQYGLMLKTLHNNAEQINSIKKSKEDFSPEEIDELTKLSEQLNKIQKFNKWIQTKAQEEDLLAQQESIRGGLKDIEFQLPELKRKK